MAQKILIPWTDEADAELVRLFLAGRSMAEISQAMGRTEYSVQGRICALRRQGVHLPQRNPVAPGARKPMAWRRTPQNAELTDEPQAGTLRTGLQPYANPCVWWTVGGVAA